MSRTEAPGFRCVGCGITVCADTNPDNYAPGVTREQVSQRRCTEEGLFCLIGFVFIGFMLAVALP